MPKANDYPYIRAWNRMMKSNSEWNIDIAREENAPTTAIYRRHGGGWAIYEEIASTDTKELITQLVEKYR